MSERTRAGHRGVAGGDRTPGGHRAHPTSNRDRPSGRVRRRARRMNGRYTDRWRDPNEPSWVVEPTTEWHPQFPGQRYPGDIGVSTSLPRRHADGRPLSVLPRCRRSRPPVRTAPTSAGPGPTNPRPSRNHTAAPGRTRNPAGHRPTAGPGATSVRPRRPPTAGRTAPTPATTTSRTGVRSPSRPGVRTAAPPSRTDGRPGPTGAPATSGDPPARPPGTATRPPPTGTTAAGPNRSRASGTGGPTTIPARRV